MSHPEPKAPRWLTPALLVTLAGAVIHGCYPDRLPERRTRVVTSNNGGDDGGADGSVDAGNGSGVNNNGSGADGGPSDAAVPDCILRVDVASNAGVPDGLTWRTAFSDIADAVDETPSVQGRAPYCELWVAAGDYEVPAAGLALTDIHVLGGFAGDEDTADERDLNANVVILSGGDPKASTIATLDGDAALSGLRVTGGELGVQVDGGDALLDQVYIHDNLPTGGLVATAGAVTIRDTVFVRNRSVNTVGGGAIKAAQAASIDIADTIFANNEAGGADTAPERSGGALLLLVQDALIRRSIFVGNTAMGSGGAINAGAEGWRVEDSVFVGNSAADTGDAVYSTSTGELVNITSYAHNTALVGALTLINGIVWSNATLALDSNAGGTPTVLGSIVEGGYASPQSQDVLVADPTFNGSFLAGAQVAQVVAMDVDSLVGLDQSAGQGALRETFLHATSGPAVGWYYILNNTTTNLTVLGQVPSALSGADVEVVDLNLKKGSPAIDRGWGNVDQVVVSDADLLGEPRADDPTAPNGAVGDPKYVDMGAYEFQP